MVGRKRIYLIALIGIMILALIGCGAKKESTNMSSDQGSYTSENKNGRSEPEEYDGASMDTASTESPRASESTASGESITSTSVITSGEALNDPREKIIRRAELEVETRDFDNLILTVDAQIKQLGGYVESSDISGRYYYSDNMRYGNIIARVPKDKLDSFINKVYDIANVVNKHESTENVTLQYVATESHKKTLEIEQERLLALLEKVESLEDIITLETRLSSVRYELESYESQLRLYDNLVEYSTVTLNIQEVERMSAAENEEKSVWSRIHSGFGDTVYDIGEGVKNFIVWFVVNLPYLAIWAVIIVVVVIVSRKYYKKYKVKYASQQQEPMPGIKKDDKSE